MLIDLEGKVIILDEAHNMEDSARDAASLSVNHIQISEALKEITELCTYVEAGFFPACSGLMLTVGQRTISGYNFIMTDHVTDWLTLCQNNFCPCQNTNAIRMELSRWSNG